MAVNYKDKINKLLALAESPNEHEAKAALLKARQLMAEHKLTEAELKDVEKQTVKNILTDITFSTRRNPWITALVTVLGENYCCKGYASHIYRKQTKQIGFVGLEDDVEICVAVFQYAVDCILSKIKEIKKENSGYPSGYIRKQCDSYGYGFIVGIFAAFEKQQEENEKDWGLILVTPKEVEEATQGWKKGKFKICLQENILEPTFDVGYEDGKEFDPTKWLAGEDTKSGGVKDGI